MRISDVLRHKGSAVCTVAPYTPMLDLLSLLHERNIGAVVITDGDSVVGIVSERDVVRGLTGGTDLLDRDVASIMTAEVQTAAPTDSVHDLMKLMTEHRIRHVPVFADGELHGIVSIGDVVKTRIGELEFERDQLTSYVSNTQ